MFTCFVLLCSVTCPVHIIYSICDYWVLHMCKGDYEHVIFARSLYSVIWLLCLLLSLDYITSKSCDNGSCVLLHSIAFYNFIAVFETRVGLSTLVNDH